MSNITIIIKKIIGIAMEKNCPDLTIIPYHPKYKPKYKELNAEWLNKYFSIEPIDEKMLSDPEQEILNNNGYIFFALSGDKAIGTCTLMKLDTHTYELSKMCVTPYYQGQGIGEKLLDEVISFAIQRGAQTITLLTNTKLKSALYLYKKKGFKETKNPKNLKDKVFMRESTYMSLDLHHEEATKA